MKKHQYLHVINIFTGEDMENVPLGSWMWFGMNFPSGILTMNHSMYASLEHG